MKENLAGLNALGQTYGIDTNLLGKAMGVPVGIAERPPARLAKRPSGLGGLFGLGSSLASLFGQ